MLVSLTEAKTHLKVSDSTEDSLITIQIRAAEDLIRKILNNPSPPVTYAVKAAALLIIGDLYENRTGAVQDELTPNPAVMNLLYPYRNNIGI
jgi:hypothetical protein